MCDPELIAAILQELGYLDEKKENDKTEEARDKGSSKDNSKRSAEEERKARFLARVDRARKSLREAKGVYLKDLPE
jgi:cysteinyl-tRNA synthetase